MLNGESYYSVVQAENEAGLRSPLKKTNGVQIGGGSTAGRVQNAYVTCDFVPIHPCPNCDDLAATGCPHVVVKWSGFTDDLGIGQYSAVLERQDSNGTWLAEGEPLLFTSGSDGFDLKRTVLNTSEAGQYRSVVCMQAIVGASSSTCGTSPPFSFDQTPPIVRGVCVGTREAVQCGVAVLKRVDVATLATWPIRVRINSDDEESRVALSR